MAAKKYTKGELNRMRDLTDYERLKRMSEEDFERNAAHDPDALAQTDETLKRFRRVRKTHRGGNDVASNGKGKH